MVSHLLMDRSYTPLDFKNMVKDGEHL